MLKEEIERRANEFCSEYEVNAHPVDIIDICNRAGIKVFEEYLPEEVSGYILIQEDDFERYGANQVIVVNLLDSPKRRRFTVSHELAHFVLHKGENSRFYAHRDAGQSNRH